MATGILAFTLIGWALVSMLLVSLAVRAAVFVKLWGWFVVPAFGLPEVGYVMAAGLMTVAMALHPPAIGDIAVRGKSNDDSDTAGKYVLLKLAMDIVLVPLVLLTLGWLLEGAI